MKRFAAIALVLALCVTLRPGFADNSVSLNASSFRFSSSNACSGETADFGPSPAGDGYVGTFSWNWSTSAGGGSVEALVVWDVSYYDTDSGEWITYDSGVNSGSFAANSSGTSYIDFFADLGTGIPYGAFQLSAWVCTGASGSIRSVLGGDTGSYVFGYDTSSLPDPEPLAAPSGDPPITNPELPPTGPIGPGSSSWTPSC